MITILLFDLCICCKFSTFWFRECTDGQLELIERLQTQWRFEGQARRPPEASRSAEAAVLHATYLRWIIGCTKQVECALPRLFADEPCSITRRVEASRPALWTPHRASGWRPCHAPHSVHWSALATFAQIQHPCSTCRLMAWAQTGTICIRSGIISLQHVLSAPPG